MASRRGMVASSAHTPDRRSHREEGEEGMAAGMAGMRRTRTGDRRHEGVTEQNVDEGCVYDEKMQEAGSSTLYF